MNLKRIIMSIAVLLTAVAAVVVVFFLRGGFSNGKSRSDSFTITDFSWGDEQKALADSVCGMLTDYYEGQAEGNFQRSMLGYPDFYVACEKQWIDANSELSYDDFMKSNDEWCKAEYGEDYRITLEIGKLLELTEESRREMEKILNASFGTAIELRNCYHFDATEHISGNLKSEDNALEWYILYYDGKVYLYDTIYES